MIDDVMDIVGLELMQDRHGNGTIGQCSQKGNTPVGAIASAKRNLVARNNTSLLEHDVQLLDTTSHIFVLQSATSVVGQRITIPVGLDAVFNSLNNVFCHSFFFKIMVRVTYIQVQMYELLLDLQIIQPAITPPTRGRNILNIHCQIGYIPHIHQ